MYTCVYIYVYMCIYIRTNKIGSLFSNTHINTYVHTCIHKCTDINQYHPILKKTFRLAVRPHTNLPFFLNLTIITFPKQPFPITF